MQTFLPYSDFYASLDVLDNRRLGKQRVEAFQILESILTNSGWINHPATKMWIGYEVALCDYGMTACTIWKNKRFYKDNLYEVFQNILLNDLKDVPFKDPLWLGDERLHSSHQNALVWKYPQYYKIHFPNAISKLDYFWPTSVKEYCNEIGVKS